MAANPKTKAKRYSIADRMAVLAILRDNRYNYLKTQRQTRVSVPSLRTWNNKYGKGLKEQSEITEAAARAAGEIQEHKQDLMEEIYDTKFQIIHRIKDLIPSARSIRVLSDALETLHGMEKDNKTPDAQPLIGDGNRDFILQFVSNQIAMVAPDGKITRANKVITNPNTEDHGDN